MNELDGYEEFDRSQVLTCACIESLQEQLRSWILEGLSGAVHMQATDVEIEINGYPTCDRAVSKIDTGRIAAFHRSLYQE